MDALIIQGISRRFTGRGSRARALIAANLHSRASFFHSRISFFCRQNDLRGRASTAGGPANAPLNAKRPRGGTGGRNSNCGFSPTPNRSHRQKNACQDSCSSRFPENQNRPRHRRPANQDRAQLPASYFPAISTADETGEVKGIAERPKFFGRTSKHDSCAP